MKLTEREIIYLGVGVAAVGAVWFLIRGVKELANETVETVGGVFSGNNAVTAGTPYQGAGILGTLGAATNVTLGGAPQSIGETLSGWLWDALHPEYAAPAPAFTPRKNVVQAEANSWVDYLNVTGSIF